MSWGLLEKTLKTGRDHLKFSTNYKELTLKVNNCIPFKPLSVNSTTDISITAILMQEVTTV